ncbi:MAG: hypothetical protein AAFQ81_05640 [Pseudomonadota bacterium]
MGKAAIGFNDLLNRAGATVTATNAVTTMPTENLRTDHVRGSAFRATALATQIDIDLGEAVEAEMLFLTGLAADATAFSTFSVLAGTTPGGADIFTGSAIGQAEYGFDAVRGQAVYVLPQGYTARYWRLLLEQTGGTNLDIGRLFLSPVLSTTQNIGMPFSVVPIDRSQQVIGQGGQVSTYRRELLREMVVTWEATNATDVDVFDTLNAALDRASGAARPIVIVPDRTTGNRPWDIRHAIYGFIRELGQMDVQGVNQYARTIRVREGG